MKMITFDVNIPKPTGENNLEEGIEEKLEIPHYTFKKKHVVPKVFSKPVCFEDEFTNLPEKVYKINSIDVMVLEGYRGNRSMVLNLVSNSKPEKLKGIIHSSEYKDFLKAMGVKGLTNESRLLKLIDMEISGQHAPRTRLVRNIKPYMENASNQMYL